MALPLEKLLDDLIRRGASDLHLKARTPVYLRVRGELVATEHPVPEPADLEALAARIFSAPQMAQLETDRQVDAPFVPPDDRSRYRASACYQRGTISLVLRHIPRIVPSLAALGVPNEAAALMDARRGMLLVTGPASSGKTTTVAALIEAYNQAREGHVVTLEDPIEFVLESKHCLINQRQIGTDTPSFDAGLRHVLRQDPDVIFVGELRDLETVTIALAAAETGHLVLSTLQTPNAATTLEQVIGMFPAQQQAQSRLQISLALAGVLSQQLVLTRDQKRRVAAFEVLAPTEALRNLVRANQTFRITDALETTPGCRSMRRALAELAAAGQIAQEDVARYSTE
ncbi:MAG: PilT/PilU family type 4a pilus ATPase [Candidatus Wallbacteria bacterium]|nr:PilT/PilU family type 4a pilus ATPase [Candidatus Wallbacteria bacterium]